MRGRLKRYPQYRPSGSGWIGDVPEHWPVVTHRGLFYEVNERNHPNEEMLSVTITQGVIKQQSLIGETGKKDGSRDDKSAYKLVCPNDLAYNKMRAWQGAIGISRHRGIISPAYVVMRLRGGDYPPYFHFLFRTPSFAKEAERWSYGITSDMWSLRPEHFRGIYSPVPPVEEQVAIVRFLDWANGRLERAIRVKRKMIGLLQEQKQAIIQRAVTRGLDPDVELKPCKLGWLAGIPSTWRIRKLKSLVSIYSGMTPSKTEAKFWGGSVPWVSPRDMKVDEIASTGLKITDLAVASTGIALVEPPAVLIVVRGMILARSFPCALTRVAVTVNQDMKILKPVHDVSPEYLCFLFRGIEIELLKIVETAGHGTKCLRSDEWEALEVPLPSYEEQVRLAGQVAIATKRLAQAIDRVEREIALLREYRTRLTADVVTGKLDVRDVEIPDDELLADAGVSELPDEETDDLAEVEEQCGDE